MSGYDIDRTLADWFEADARALVPTDGLERALEGARRRRPRAAWLAGPGSHWGWTTPTGGTGVGLRVLPGSGMRRSTAVILAVALGLLLGGAAFVGARLLEPPPLPPRLGQLAYALDGDIFLSDWDGTNPVRIADGLSGSKSGCGRAGYGSEGSMWSPDGRYLAYRSGRSQTDCDRPKADTIPTVLLSDPAGEVVTEVHGVGWSIAWSPDSTRVATWLDLYPSTKIGVYGIDGSRQVLELPPALYGTNFGDYDPIWSPDGESLLVLLHDKYMTCTPGMRMCQNARQVWEVPIDGRPPRRLPAEDPRSHWASPRSPDGKRVAYVADEGIPDFGEAELVVAAADGSQPRVLFTAGIHDVWWTFPLWSRTGDSIAFVPGVTADLLVVDVASGSVTTVAPADGDHLSVMAFSPEGDRILFARRDPEGEGRGLWSVGTDASDLQQLVTGSDTGDWQSLVTGGSP